ncbi:MAG: FKBP-type peptidyl-prolyl cis-trans isomerase [Chitinophagales bacterium]|nr:FKBP-type peptidyl-prolyl cis-trans isomerase [Chitinophagales bacterium]
METTTIQIKIAMCDNTKQQQNTSLRFRVSTKTSVTTLSKQCMHPIMNIKKGYFFIFAFFLCVACNQHKIPVKCGDTVTLAYKMTNTKGMRLDESFLHDNFNHIQENELFRFTTCNGEVIPGWDSVILGCKTGKLYTFDIPASLAYGKSDIYHDIPAGSDIILKFKIFKIE